jgi:DNA-binding CsgD family transcriptional regulator
MNRISQAATELTRAVLGSGTLAHVLGTLAAETQSTKALWSRADLSSGLGKIIYNHNFSTAFCDAYNAQRAGENLWLRAADSLKIGCGVFTGDQLLPSNRVWSSAFQRMLAREAIEHTLHLLINMKDAVFIHIVLARGKSESRFGTSEAGIADIFQNHAATALGFSNSAQKERAIQTGLANAAIEAGIAFAVIDPPRFVYKTSNLAEMLDRPNDRMNVADDERGYPFPPELIEAVLGHSGSSTTTVSFRRATRPGRLIARIKPLFQSDLLTGQNRRLLAISIFDPDRRIVVDESLLMSTFDLTRSEARICTLLAAGKSIDQIAREVKISHHTARTHLQRILKKTKTTRQAELIALALKSAMVTPAFDRPFAQERGLETFGRGD